MDSRFQILNPCVKRWEDLSGEGRKRFCPDCQTYVHSLAQYTPQEIVALKKAQGRVCGYLGGESLIPSRSRRAILAGALLTMVSPLFAQSGRVRIRVTDASGAVIPSAEASLIGKDEKPTRTTKANQDGEILLTDLPIGDARVRVSCPGFVSHVVTVSVRNGDEAQVQIVLLEGFVVGEIILRRKHWWNFRR